MTKLTKEKIRAMMPRDCIFFACNNAAEVDSAFQTAVQVKNESEENAKRFAVSKSYVTLSVVIRTGILN